MGSLTAFSYLSSLKFLLMASISSSRYTLRNDNVFVRKVARIIPYVFSEPCLPYWSYDYKVPDVGEDIFTSGQGSRCSALRTQRWQNCGWCGMIWGLEVDGSSSGSNG